MQGSVPSLALDPPPRLGAGPGLLPATVPLCLPTPDWDGVALPTTPSCDRPSWGPWLQGLRYGALVVEVGVFSSASTSLTPFFFPLFLAFLSLSLFWSFSLFSLFLLSDLGT